MRKIRTKSRKNKRFPFEEVRNITIYIWNPNTSHWYKHEKVTAKLLGLFAYHWFLEGYYTVFIYGCGIPILSFETEREAKRFVKQLYLVKGINPATIKNRYDPKEDIPF